MATSTQSFRPDEHWTQMRITTRSSPPKEPRDERLRIAGMARRPPPLPVDVKLAQTNRSAREVSNGLRCERETLREPEIVDLAPLSSSSRPWMGRHDVRPPPYPPPPPPPRFKSKHKLRGPPSVASRQSETSFGILDLYIRDPSPLASPDLPVDAKPPIGPAMGGFDFELRKESAETPDVKSGADEEMQLIPLSPRPFEENKPETNLPHAKNYSLFPAVREVTPSTHRLARVINDSPADSHQAENISFSDRQAPGWRPRLLSGAKLTNTPTPIRRRADTTPSSTQAQAASSPAGTTTIRSPSYHPRNPSLTFSTNPARLPSASISSGSGSSTQTRRIPLRILSSSSTATTATTCRSSISTSPGSTIASQQKPLLSRWSEDTALASPTTAVAVLGGCRTSFGSLLGVEMVGGGNGETYPACFFEDDEEVPLRRRRGRRGSEKGWRWWICCGEKG